MAEIIALKYDGNIYEALTSAKKPFRATGSLGIELVLGNTQSDRCVAYILKQDFNHWKEHLQKLGAEQADIMINMRLLPRRSFGNFQYKDLNIPPLETLARDAQMMCPRYLIMREEKIRQHPEFARLIDFSRL